jgi:hypothetical protein
MQMWHRLSGGSTIIDADVVTSGMKFRFGRSLCNIQQPKQRVPLWIGCLKEGTNMALRYNETMPRRNRKTITNPDCVIILAKNAL